MRLCSWKQQSWSGVYFHKRVCHGLQGWCLLAQLPAGSPWHLHHVLGLALWAAGWLANMHCDALLRNLRQSEGDTGGRCW
jgi:hypothetical protein